MSIFEHIDKRMVIGFVTVLVVLAGGFFYWLSGDSGSAGTGAITVFPTSPLDATLGRDLLVALATLKSTKLDTSIFTDPVFVSLKDFSVDISAQPVGRRNPFATFDAGAFSKTPAKPGIPGQTANTPPKTTTATTPDPKTPAPEPGGFDIN